MYLVTELYTLTQKFPKEEIYGLVSQIRRAVVSIVSNIAEGYNRKHRREYTQFLAIAYGSCGELTTQLEVARRLNYVAEVEIKKCDELLNEVGKMLYTMIQKLQSQP